MIEPDDADWTDENDQIASTLVIPGLHDDIVAIFFNWESGRLSAYSVDSVEEAIAELKRLNITRNIQWASPEPDQ